MKNKMTMSDFEALLHKATSNDPSFLSDTQIKMLVARTKFPYERRLLLDHLFLKLSGPVSRWRKILKALYIAREVADSGAGEAKLELRSKITVFKRLETFHYVEEGVDRGAHVRKVASSLVEKLTDKSKTREQIAAKKINELEANFLREKLNKVQTRKPGSIEALGLGADFLDYEADYDENSPDLNPKDDEMNKQSSMEYSNIFPREDSLDAEQIQKLKERLDSDEEDFIDLKLDVPRNNPQTNNADFSRKSNVKEQKLMAIDEDFLDF